jgi:Flp pilus assembly pilin Flp
MGGIISGTLLTEKIKGRKAQSVLELSVIIAVIAVTLVATSVYMKRAMQGKLKAVADDIGEQYSPLYTDSETTTQVNSTATSDMKIENEGTLEGSIVTTSDTTETNTRSGYEKIQGYKNETLF